MGHIAVSDGMGGTVEAKGIKYGVVRDVVSGRRWDTGVLVPGISYSRANTGLTVEAPKDLYAIGMPNMAPDIVMTLQRSLMGRGLYPGPIDGIFGPKTQEAVLKFQELSGLVVDGEVGKSTAAELGLSIARSISQVGLLGAGVAINPLVATAALVFPEIIRSIGGPHAEQVRSNIVGAVTSILGTDDPVAARQRVQDDPIAATALQTKLVEIAVTNEGKPVGGKGEKPLDVQKVSQVAKLDEGKSSAGDASRYDGSNAREAAIAYANMGGPMSWGALAVSVAVIIGFFLVLASLLIWGNTLSSASNNLFEVMLIIIGTLTAAFSTVISFWLGSSQGSRLKDVASLDLQVDQARQAEQRQKQVSAALLERGQPLKPGRNNSVTEPKKSTFRECVDIILSHEGGFSDHPQDRGGPTKYGISTPVLAEWRGRAVSRQDVEELETEEAREIYRTRYWNVLRCDDLPAGIDLVVFDAGVNTGQGRAARFLQDAVGAKPDGAVGPATLAATRVADPKLVVAAVSAKRRDYYTGLPTFPTFGKGWSDRTDDILKKALEMIKAGEESV